MFLSSLQQRWYRPVQRDTSGSLSAHSYCWIEKHRPCVAAYLPAHVGAGGGGVGRSVAGGVGRGVAGGGGVGRGVGGGVGRGVAGAGVACFLVVTVFFCTVFVVVGLAVVVGGALHMFHVLGPWQFPVLQPMALRWLAHPQPWHSHGLVIVRSHW